MTRKALEQLAKDTVSPELFYDLCNEADNMSEEELRKIISFGGDYSKEEAWQTEMEQM